MEIKEAIELLDNLLGMIEDNHGNDYDEALHMAISALEKQAPKKPIGAKRFADLYLGFCPSCGEGNYSEYGFCGKCGQATDWAEAADDESMFEKEG